MDINEKIRLAAEMACLLEVSAEKPGNVTPSHDFTDTKYEDFLISGAAIGSAFRNITGYSVGDVILRAVKDTRELTGVNTNLGIVLLLAPLAKAFALSSDNNLRDNLRHVLKNLTIDDAKLAYESIRIAQPGGMGKINENDVNGSEINITLLKAMAEAKDRDSIASEYFTGYEITFEIGLPVLKDSIQKGLSIRDAIVQTFLIILSQVPDTLIARKTGKDKAKEMSDHAKHVLKSGGVFSTNGHNEIKNLDNLLRRGEKSFAQSNHLNPGTTADLVAARVVCVSNGK